MKHVKDMLFNKANYEISNKQQKIEIQQQQQQQKMEKRCGVEKEKKMYVNENRYSNRIKKINNYNEFQFYKIEPSHFNYYFHTF